MLQLCKRSKSASTVSAFIGEILAFMLQYEPLFLRLVESRVIEYGTTLAQHADDQIRQWAYTLLANIMSLHEESRIEVAHDAVLISILLKSCDVRRPSDREVINAQHALVLPALVSATVADRLKGLCQAAMLLIVANEAEDVVNLEGVHPRYALLWMFLRVDRLKDTFYEAPRLLVQHFDLAIGLMFRQKVCHEWNIHLLTLLTMLSVSCRGQ